MGLEWNKLQLTIAKMLLDKDNPKTQLAIQSELGCSEGVVLKVNKALHSGIEVPPLDDESIAKAKAPLIIPGGNSYKKLSQNATTPIGDNGSKPHSDNNPTLTPPGVPAKASGVTVSASEAAIIRMLVQRIEFPITPDIMQSYMRALESGYKGSFQDWIRLCCRDFWDGRNVPSLPPTILFSEEKPVEEQQKEEVKVG